jgi:hypothetical protein
MGAGIPAGPNVRYSPLDGIVSKDSRHNSEMEPQERRIDSPLCTRRRTTTSGPEQDHSRSGRSNGWAECREKKIGIEPKGSSLKRPPGQQAARVWNRENVLFHAAMRSNDDAGPDLRDLYDTSFLF